MAGGVEANLLNNGTDDTLVSVGATSGAPGAPHHLVDRYQFHVRWIKRTGDTLSSAISKSTISRGCQSAGRLSRRRMPRRPLGRQGLEFTHREPAGMTLTE